MGQSKKPSKNIARLLFLLLCVTTLIFITVCFFSFFYFHEFYGSERHTYKGRYKSPNSHLVQNGFSSETGFEDFGGTVSQEESTEEATFDYADAVIPDSFSQSAPGLPHGAYSFLHAF